MDSDQEVFAAITAASSTDWSVRSLAAERLAVVAERSDAAECLLALLLDPYDTGVTADACHVLLRRGDVHAIRLIAHATATADNDEILDHFYAALSGELLPDGPVDRILDVCRRLDRDPEPAVHEGTRTLLTWIAPWAGL